MSLESARVKVETEHEEWACSVKREPALGPELLHAPDVACPPAGTSDATFVVKQEFIIEVPGLPSHKCPGIETAMSVQSVELKLEPDCIKKEDEEKEMEQEFWCEVAPRSGLYVDPELLQAPHIAVLPISENSAPPRPASQASAASGASGECLGEGPPYNESHGEQQALRTSSVRLERMSTYKHVYTRKEQCEQSALTAHPQNVPEVLPSKAALRQHKQAHTADKPHKCHVCDKFYKSSTSLSIHSRIHTGVKPYACDVCKQQFAHKHHLKVHKLIHTREKPYACDFCNKQFTHLSSLLNHKRIHTGEKPYACDICNKRFAQLGSFTKHKSVHTGEKPYACNICNKHFSRKDSVAIHTRRHYSTEIAPSS